MFVIDVEIKNAWIRQLKQDWRNANYCYFKNKMKLPNISLLDSKKVLGKWVGGIKRGLSINGFFISRYPWQYVQEVLYHEMAHQYVEEILGITQDLPHGKEFRKICYDNEFDHHATGDIQDWIKKKKKSVTGSQEHKMLNKVQKLLALAQSKNLHEAESAMSKAQELLLKHNLKLLEFENKRKYISKQIGEVGRKNPVKSLIGSIISKFFFVEALWAFGYDRHKNKGGRILEIYGIPRNIEMAEYVHDYLHHISEKLWRDYKEQKNICGDRHRRTYIYGLLNGFYQKLGATVVRNETKSLVWIGDSQLKEYFHRKNPRIKRTTSCYSRSCREAYNSGLTSGKRLVIHRGITTRNSGRVYLLQ